ncbi:MAG: hypothetical protein ACI8QS_003805, partial [Planctomycetota bacterium]
MSTSRNERRTTERTQASYRLDTWDDRDGFLGCILDLSGHGARVLVLEKADVETVKSIRLDLPRWLNMGSSLDFKGRFVWCRTQRETGAREAGFSFDPVSGARQRKL